MERKTEDRKQVIVIGGGASGMMAAGTAGERGRQVLLLEKNRNLGRKLLITGKGRCNLTNRTDVAELVANIPGNGRFLTSAFYHFGPEDLIAFFARWGVETKTERGNRVFPVSDNAADVVHALERFLRAGGVTIRTECAAQSLLTENGAIRGVQLKDGTELVADAVVLATGGASYPGTGTTGDGYRMAKEVGHSITPIRPSLVPLEVAEEWAPRLQGLSLRNVDLYALSPEGKTLWHERGEMLFTHFGVSGPLVLSASRRVLDCKGCRLRIDLKPALTEEQLDARVQRDFKLVLRKQLGNSLGRLLPHTLIPVVLEVAGLSPEEPVHQVTRAQRLALVHTLKSLMLTVTRPRSLAEAIVTAGGVSTREIDPRTMESRLVSRLYLTGEVIDVDGYTGGFNLQAAFTTGRIAGENA